MPISDLCIFQRQRSNDTILITVPKGKTIFMQDQNAAFIYHLHEGVVGGVRVTKDGHEITDLCVPPGFIGLAGFMNMYSDRSRAHLGEARAITPVTYCRVRREVVWELMGDREARARIVHLICSGVLSRGMLTASSLKNDVSNRVLHTLQILARSVGKRGADDITTVKNISHGDIALIANTTRSTVTRILTRLEEVGMIKVGLRQIEIPNRRVLLELSSFNAIDKMGQS
jgi:CRP-like cAMP-binding protein